MFNFKSNDKSFIKDLTSMLVNYDFRKFTINLKYGYLITNFPRLVPETKDEFVSKFSMFRNDNPENDYHIIFKDNRIIFSSPVNTFTMTDFNLFLSMSMYFELNKSENQLTDENYQLKGNNIIEVLNAFFDSKVKGNYIFRDSLTKYICQNFDKKNDCWISIDNISREKIIIHNLRYSFMYNDDIIYNALIDNSRDLESGTCELKIKFDPYTRIEFKDRYLNESYEEFSAMSGENGIDVMIRFDIERNISRNIFTDLYSLLNKFKPIHSNFTIDRNTENYILYYNALKLLL